VAAVLHEITVSALFLAIAGLLLVTAKFSRGHEAQNAGLELTHVIKGHYTGSDTGSVKGR